MLSYVLWNILKGYICVWINSLGFIKFVIILLIMHICSIQNSCLFCLGLLKTKQNKKNVIGSIEVHFNDGDNASFLQFQLPVKQTVLEKKSTREKKKKKLKRLRLNSMNSNELQTKNPFLNNSHACTVVLSLSSDVWPKLVTNIWSNANDVILLSNFDKAKMGGYTGVTCLNLVIHETKYDHCSSISVKQ